MPAIVKLLNSDGDRDVYVNADRISFFVGDQHGKTDIHFGPGDLKVVGQPPEEVLAKIQAEKG
jgi:hypothetical protein